MKSLLIACGVFAIGLAVLSAVPDADLLPQGVKTVLSEVAGVW